VSEQEYADPRYCPAHYRQCGQFSRDGIFVCTRALDHEDPHVAHINRGTYVCEEWR
jgi:hypothetical protein